MRTTAKLSLVPTARHRGAAAATGSATEPSPDVAVVVITRNRRPDLLRTLSRLVALPDAAQVVVVDNGSADGSADAVRTAFPQVQVVALGQNLGAVGRTVGARATSCPVIAFADDDSWWEPGALAAAQQLFARHERLGLLHGTIVVEPAGEVDPACRKMAAGQRTPGSPGPDILGHLGCGAIVRRSAYLDAGGYSPVLQFGGEERLLSLDLASAGWQQAYVEGLVAHHEPSPRREDWPVRWARYRRNDTLVAVLRLPLRWAVRETAALLRDAVREPTVRRELVRFLRLLPRALSERRPVPPAVAERLAEFLGRP